MSMNPPRKHGHTYRDCTARIAIACCVVAIATLASAPTTACGRAERIVVTATIGPSFSLTLLTPSHVDFGEVVLGRVYELPGATHVRVQSNRPWDFIDSSSPYLIGGEAVVARQALLTNTTSLPFGTGKPPGVHHITADYRLDLTRPEAHELPAGVTVGTMFGYTAVQR